MSMARQPLGGGGGGGLVGFGRGHCGSSWAVLGRSGIILATLDMFTQYVCVHAVRFAQRISKFTLIHASASSRRGVGGVGGWGGSGHSASF